MGMMGDIYDGLKPKDLERFSLKVLSGDRGGEKIINCHQHRGSVSYSVLLFI